MTRITSLDFLALANAQESGDFPILLFTISHDDLSEDVLISTDPTQRITESDTEVVYGTVSNGDDYLFLPIKVTLPGEQEEGASSMQVEIDNVSRELVATVRSIDSPPTVQVDIVLASDPDTVIGSWPEFKMANIKTTAQTISGELVLEDMAMEPFPAGTFNPSEFPGCF